MTYRRRGRGPRPAFTLIEMLVVIAIIAILVGLTAAAVMKALVKGPELTDRSEIAEMEPRLASVQNLAGHEVPHLPSRLMLRKQNGYNTNNPVERDTVAFLQTHFGRHACYDFAPLSGNTFIDWNGDGQKNETITLQGEQVLVFLLGGVPSYGNGGIAMTGFSQNSQNPALAVQTQGESRQGPYFEFQTARLRLPTSKPPYTAASAQANGGTFPMYLDPWNAPQNSTAAWGQGMPYAFFASYATEGGGQYNYYGSSDSLAGAAPYYTATSPTIAWLKPGSFQIISAGRDGVFGPGGLFDPTAGLGKGPGADDQANFSPRPLAAAAN